MLSLSDPAVGTVIAAFIAALVSLLGLIISKEQKTSEFRQAWIDALRADIGAVVAHANAIHGVAAANFDTPAKTWEAASEHFVGINKATASIRLRLNRNELESQAVLAAIDDLESHLNPGALNAQDMNVIEKRLVSEAQILLKKEWLRVRSGEPVFRIAKALLFIFLLVSMVFLANSIFRYNDPTPQSNSQRAANIKHQ